MLGAPPASLKFVVYVCDCATFGLRHEEEGEEEEDEKKDNERDECVRVESFL